jgi:hypothetical protein
MVATFLYTAVIIKTGRDQMATEKLCDGCEVREAVTEDYLCRSCQAEYDADMDAQYEAELYAETGMGAVSLGYSVEDARQAGREAVAASRELRFERSAS